MRLKINGEPQVGRCSSPSLLRDVRRQTTFSPTLKSGILRTYSFKRCINRGQAPSLLDFVLFGFEILSSNYLPYHIIFPITSTYTMANLAQGWINHLRRQARKCVATSSNSCCTQLTLFFFTATNLPQQTRGRPRLRRSPRENSHRERPAKTKRTMLLGEDPLNLLRVVTRTLKMLRQRENG